MGIAQRLEEYELMLARRDDAAYRRVVSEHVAVEGGAVVLVMDLELRRGVEAASEHVRSRALQADQVDRGGRPRSLRM